MQTQFYPADKPVFNSKVNCQPQGRSGKLATVKDSKTDNEVKNNYSCRDNKFAQVFTPRMCPRSILPREVVQNSYQEMFVELKCARKLQNETSRKGL